MGKTKGVKMKTAETIAGKLASCEVSIASVLGGAKFLHKKIENRLDLVNLVDEGISKASLLHLARYLHFSTKQMAEVLPVTERTIQRYDNEKQFAPVVSDHILQIAEVSAKGTAVFQDKIKFLLWMNNPCTSFANKTPKSLLKSKFGIDMILDELGRIEHGIFS